MDFEDADLMREAWLIAASDLQLEVTSPFQLPDLDGSPVEFIALVRDFGSPKGALLCAIEDWPAVNEVADRAGYFVSGLAASSYATYDRANVIDTLRDWGWYGQSDAPSWFTR